jgi:hypothetical protein
VEASGPGRRRPSVTVLAVSEQDWVEWHEPYDQPGSSMQRRLELVQQRIREVLDGAPPGPIRAISVCAGQSRDLLEVLEHHPRKEDVRARLVELDEGNVEYARNAARSLGLRNVECACGDASLAAAYKGAVPADLVLICGVFGNISDNDIGHTIENASRFCTPGATVIWTRHRREPDATPMIRACFQRAGFEEIAFDAEDGFLFGVGTARLVENPQPFDRSITLFDFIGDGSDARL